MMKYVAIVAALVVGLIASEAYATGGGFQSIIQRQRVRQKQQVKVQRVVVREKVVVPVQQVQVQRIYVPVQQFGVYTTDPYQQVLQEELFRAKVRQQQFLMQQRLGY